MSTNYRLDILTKALLELIHKLLDALDDEVLFCINTKNDVSPASVSVLEQCQKLGLGTSEALKELDEENNLSAKEIITLMRGSEEDEGID